MFREIIRKTIFERELKIEKVAEAIGMNKANLYAYLKGGRNLNLKHLDNLIHYLGLYLVPKDGFVFDENKIPSHIKESTN